MPGILVIALSTDGTAGRSSLELVGGARLLDGTLNLGVAAALLGRGTSQGSAAATLHEHGVATIYRVDHPSLEPGETDAFLAAAEASVRVATPQIVLVGADTVGRDVAVRLAHRMGAALVTECVSVAPESGHVVAVRQAYGGRAAAALVVTRWPAVLSIKPRSLDAAAPAPVAGRVQDVPVTIDTSALPTRVREIRREQAELSLDDAEIVISGGRGLGGPEGFKLLEELAKVLGGAVGSSRPPADAGWVPVNWQIGQTGKTIRPSLYIAVGISGATQHVAGMAGSRTIVAINKDAEAPIFGLAHLGIVGDYREVIPPLIRKVKELKGG